MSSRGYKRMVLGNRQVLEMESCQGHPVWYGHWDQGMGARNE